MKRIIAACLLSFAFATPAVATGFYAGVNTGWAEHKLSPNGYTEGVTAYSVLAGYAFIPYLAVEGEYANLGSIVSDFAKITARSVSIVGYYPIEPQLALFAKLGSATTQEKYSGLTVSQKARTFALGGQFIVNDFMDFRFGVTRYTYGGDKGLNAGTANFYSAGVIFRY